MTGIFCGSAGNDCGEFLCFGKVTTVAGKDGEATSFAGVGVSTTKTCGGGGCEGVQNRFDGVVEY